MRVRAAILAVALLWGSRAEAQSRDSLVNGVLMGLAAGGAATVIFTVANCGGLRSDSECSAIAGPVGALIFLPAGAITGALIDRAIGNDRVSLVPRLTKRTRSVALTVRF